MRVFKISCNEVMDRFINENKIIVFDVGGTLMEYTDMPLNWVDYYPQGFENINNKYCLNLSDKDIKKSVDVMRSFNPRINYRENEIPPEMIFEKATEHWQCDVRLPEIIKAFFDGLNLNVNIFDYALPVINFFRDKGLIVGMLTDLPSGMPDELFKSEICNLINSCDFYISSQSCGYRKPNPYALYMISKKYNVDLKEILLIGDENKDRITAENAECGFLHIKQLQKKLLDIE